MAAVSSIAGSSIMYLRAMCLTAGGILHVAPLPTMREIKRNGSVMNYHIAPYASTLLNHSINGYYAFVRGDPALMTHRTAGVIANLCYIYFYLSYCPPTRMPEAKRFLTRVVIIFSAMMTVLHVLLPMLGKTKYFFNTLATFGAFTGIGLAASLLVTIGDVIRNRDSSSLPFGLGSVVTLQCFGWAVYGYMQSDWSTCANNSVGFCLACTQLFLIFWFPNKRAARALPMESPTTGSGAGKKAAFEDAGLPTGSGGVSSPGGSVGSSSAVAGVSGASAPMDSHLSPDSSSRLAGSSSDGAGSGGLELPTSASAVAGMVRKLTTTKKD